MRKMLASLRVIMKLPQSLRNIEQKIPADAATERSGRRIRREYASFRSEITKSIKQASIEHTALETTYLTSERASKDIEERPR